ncbi:MAG: tetratricopeptide repeat protein [Acidipila sp.]|nr:tetratricopeptide repeat protein [Acidipila sp.]
MVTKKLLFLRAWCVLLCCAPALAQYNPDRIGEAKSLYQSGKYGEAIDICRSVLTQSPASMPAYSCLVTSLLRRDDVTEAAQAARRALELAPQSPVPHDLLGEVYYRQGKLTEAQAEYKNALALGGALARAWWGLGRIAAASSMHKTAAKLYESAFQLDPKDPDIFRSYSSGLGKKERSAALEKYLGAGIPLAEANSPEVVAEGAHTDGKMWELLSPYQKTEVGLENIYHSAHFIAGVGLPVSLNGGKPLVLLLDTGASGILLTQKAAERAGVKRVSAAEISGIGDQGPVKGYWGLVEKVRVGNVEFRNCPVEVAEQNSVADDNGVIGADVFREFLVTIDIHRLNLRLAPLPKREAEPDAQGRYDRTFSPDTKDFDRVFRYGHMLLIPTRVNKSEPLLFLLDTGAFVNYIDQDVARSWTSVQKESSVQARGISGKVKQVYVTGVVMLNFGGFRQPNLGMVAIDMASMSRHPGVEVAGILGYTLLRELVIAIDYRDGLVKFTRSE